MDRYVARPGRPKGRRAQKTETVAHNSVFAGHREAGYHQRTPFDPAAAGRKLRGYSSFGRAVALQAIGQGFESPYLQAWFGVLELSKQRSQSAEGSLSIKQWVHWSC